jgi:hypothetical protein
MHGVHIHTFEDTFTGIDENGDGSVSPLEFKHAMHSLGFRLNKKQLDALVEYVDADGSGNIDYVEFVTQITRRAFGEPRGDPTQNGTLHVLDASNLQSADKLDHEQLGSDPYVDIYYNDVKIASTRVLYDDCHPVFNERFTIPVRADKMNELRLEVFDHDDDPVDQTPDFLGQVVLRGNGSDGLPDVKVTYPLTKKMKLPKESTDQVSNWRARFNAVESESEIAEKAGKEARQLQEYNATVGGTLSLRFTSHEEKQAIAKVAAVTDPSLLDCLATPHVETQLDLSFSNLQHWMDWEDDKGNRTWGMHKGHMEEMLRARGEKHWTIHDVNGPKGARYGAAAAVALAKREGRPSPFPVGRRPTFSLIRKLNLSRNGLTKFTGLMDTLIPVLPFNCGHTIHTVDLSFNELVELDVNFLQEISQCASLALHGNPTIVSWQEIQKLEMLRCLQKLTLHGGAFDQLPHYRQRVVAMLPNLRQLDYSTVTPADRANAAEFQLHPNYTGKGWRSHVTRDRNKDIAGGGNVSGHPAMGGTHYKSKLSKDERRQTYTRLSRPLGQVVDFEALGLSTSSMSMGGNSQRRSKSSMA